MLFESAFKIYETEIRRVDKKTYQHEIGQNGRNWNSQTQSLSFSLALVLSMKIIGKSPDITDHPTRGESPEETGKTRVITLLMPRVIKMSHELLSTATSLSLACCYSAVRPANLWYFGTAIPLSSSPDVISKAIGIFRIQKFQEFLRASSVGAKIQSSTITFENMESVSPFDKYFISMLPTAM